MGCKLPLLNLAKEQLQRLCAVFLVCWETFTERYPNSFVKAEEASIRKAFLGVGLVLIKICSTSRTKLVQVHVEALRQ